MRPPDHPRGAPRRTPPDAPPPNTLAALQRALQDHLLHGDPRIASALCGGGIGPERRLAIYHRGYRLRLLAALKDSFGHCARWLGDEPFDALALAYIEDHASTSSSLNDYGAGLPDWIARARPGLPACAELARLDWALRRAFDGPDSAVLTRETLAALPPQAWGSAGFALVPTWCLLAQRFNTLALWLALDHEAPPPAATPLPQPQAVVVWRRDHRPHFRSLGRDEAQALQQLASGARFAELCGTLAAQVGEGQAVATAGGWLQQWVDEGLLAAVTDAGDVALPQRAGADQAASVNRPRPAGPRSPRPRR